jgi:hypothetical protein
MKYKSLNADRVIETIDLLSLRINARFPDSGLYKVSLALAATARECAGEAARLQAANLPIRLGVGAILAMGAAAFAIIAAGIHFEAVEWEAASLIQVLEPAMNLAVLVGIGVVSLSRLETRYKRARALDYLHELRAIAHVIDMHQLTKDPYRYDLPDTPHSPQARIEGALLERYLDYCSELLSLTAKIAALFAQTSRDGEVAAAASDVEQLASGLGRQIWQKIMAFPGRTAS